MSKQITEENKERIEKRLRGPTPQELAGMSAIQKIRAGLDKLDPFEMEPAEIPACYPPDSAQGKIADGLKLLPPMKPMGGANADGLQALREEGWPPK